MTYIASVVGQAKRACASSDRKIINITEELDGIRTARVLGLTPLEMDAAFLKSNTSQSGKTDSHEIRMPLS